ncbi:hypothetical protein [Lignipirellula cremea]|uniref:Uncharacterized protein n=1 Tax=Lignipirellula cremea TaxID=2528010 RepID=A0A518DSC4_9BACT|nr:hypothetical protein [Lignipirellula cremea]QDU94741.1 hypothetical protein Pla8534_25470 [Lignipirellula cremea]
MSKRRPLPTRYEGPLPRPSLLRILFYDVQGIAPALVGLMAAWVLTLLMFYEASLTWGRAPLSSSNDRYPVASLAILGTLALTAWLTFRVRHIRRLFRSGVSVQAKLLQVETALSRRWHFEPQAYYHFGFTLDGVDYRPRFLLSQQWGDQLPDPCWLRVDAENPKHALIERLYTDARLANDPRRSARP